MRENIRKKHETQRKKQTYSQKKEKSEISISSFVQLEQSPFNLPIISPIVPNTVEINDIPSASLSYVSESSTCNSDLSIEIFLNHLRCWTIKHHIAQTAVSDLLKIIKSNLKLHSLPSDARTILKTEDITNKIICLEPGKYYHFGLKSQLALKLNQNDFESNEVNISINIDGLPLTKSSGSQFWPILIKIDKLEKVEPFPVGIYHGENKPTNSNMFLLRFIEEMKILQKEGLNFNGRIVKVSISKILCDAPAKSFILCIKNFNFYQNCTKYYAEGQFQKNRMTFAEFNSKLRTNEEFYSQADEDYHKETSLLCDLKIDLVTSVPLDYMHLVLLGVMKRLIGFWIKGNQQVRLFKEDIHMINEKLKIIYKSTPYEFSRKPRQITEYERWKAVELRTFLLYYGPWLIKPFLKEQYFLHFLSLHCAIRILICDDLIEKYIDYAHELLIYFASKFGNLYGNEYVNHNVHNLIHLTLDVKKFGSLDKFSCFPFENYMHKIKMMLKTSNKPLSQFIKRVKECDKYTSYKIHDKLYLKENGFDFINNKHVKCFSSIYYKNFKIETKEPNCNFLLKNNEAIKVINIFQMDNEFCIKYIKLKLIPYFENPMDSTIFWCGLVHTTNKENIVSIEDISRKAYKIEDCFLSILHK